LAAGDGAGLVLGDGQAGAGEDGRLTHPSCGAALLGVFRAVRCPFPITCRPPS
jgi:hypothetical protein